MRARQPSFPPIAVALALLTLLCGFASSCGDAPSQQGFVSSTSAASLPGITTSTTNGTVTTESVHPGSTSTVPIYYEGNPSMTVLAETNPIAYTLGNQVRTADVIVYGKVTEVLPAQWNTTDGKFPVDVDDPSASGAAVIYRTFMVEPEETLSGEPMFGTPIAVMVDGGTEGEVCGPVDVGDKVLVFVKYHPSRYGAGEGGLEWREKAYHATNGEWTIFKETDSGLTNLAVLAGMGECLMNPALKKTMAPDEFEAQRFDYLTLDRVRAAVESAGAAGR